MFISRGSGGEEEGVSKADPRAYPKGRVSEEESVRYIQAGGDHPCHLLEDPREEGESGRGGIDRKKEERIHKKSIKKEIVRGEVCSTLWERSMEKKKEIGTKKGEGKKGEGGVCEGA